MKPTELLQFTPIGALQGLQRHHSPGLRNRRFEFDPRRPYYRILLILLALQVIVGNNSTVRDENAAEVLREESGIKIGGTAADGLTTSTYYIKDAGNLSWQKTSRT